MSESSPVTAPYVESEPASELVRVLDEYLAALQKGMAPDRSEILAKHPEMARQLDSCLAALDFIHEAGQAHSVAETPAQLGDFRIVREIGRGGMGVVYEAIQVSLNRPVALKVLRFGAADPNAMDRFQREAETVAKLHHTNIVPVFAVGCEGGVHFFAMQLIDGESLDKAAATKPDFTTVARWGMQAAEALAHAHARGVIHRDIKPSNLLLDREGTVWLTDFGLARQSNEVTMTLSGVLMGTPRYMSPEQASATQNKVDARSDVYSLGATLYELTTGKPVYDGNTPQRVIAQILQEEPTPPRRHIPTMPRDLETVLLKCLAKDPKDRYGSAQDMADDLRRFASGEPVKARRPNFRERTLRWARKNRKQVVILAVTAFLSMGLAVGSAIAVIKHLEKERNRVQKETEATFGHITLKTDGPPLVVEILNESSDVVAKVAVPDEKSIALWPGSYTLRIRGPWKVVDSLPLTVTPGMDFEVHLDMSGEVTFTTSGPPLVGEIQDQNGEAMVPAFPIPTDKPIVVPSGFYRVKLRGPWLPTEYESLSVEASQKVKVNLNLVGRLSLQSNGPPLTGEVLNASGESVIPAFTLPTPDPISLPVGEHTLRLTGTGAWTENYSFAVNRGITASRSLNFSERTFGAQIKFTLPPNGMEPVDAWVITTGGKTDVVTISKDGLKRIDWETGRQIWSEVPSHPSLDAAPHGGSVTTGKWGEFFKYRQFSLGDNDPTPTQARLVQPSPDLDGDGVPDLLFSSRWVPGLMAVSGKTGKVLWYHTHLPPPLADQPNDGWEAQPSSCVPMGMPLLYDIDGDGVPDIIAAIHGSQAYWKNSKTKEQKATGGGVWIEAISGKTGKVLWAGFVEHSMQVSIGQLAYAAHISKLNGKAVLSVLAGRALAVFDVVTGKVIRKPEPLAFTPVGVPKVCGGERPLFLVGCRKDTGDCLMAIDALDGTERWSHSLGFSLQKETFEMGFAGQHHHPHCPPLELLELADLDGDGKQEVLVALAHESSESWDERSGGGVVVLDGDTGKPRWEYRFPLPKEGYQHGYCRIKVIPDLNGDGKPEIAVARRHWVTKKAEKGSGHFVEFNLAVSGDYVEYGLALLNGSDGKPLWNWEKRTERTGGPTYQFGDIGRLATWNPGRDGKPQLVLPVFQGGSLTGDLWLFDSTTGRFDREVKQFGQPIAADLNGDGIPDLYSYRLRLPGVPNPTDFSLGAIRGTCPDEWRGLDVGVPGPDVDGDGIPDLFQTEIRDEPKAPQSLTARSGATGRLLWRSNSDANIIRQHLLAEDLNDDGVPDLLLVNGYLGGQGYRNRVSAVCGKTGRVLWKSQELTAIVNGKTLDLSEQFVFLRTVRLRTGEIPAVIGLSWAWDKGATIGCQAFALSGSDGHLLWQTRVGPDFSSQGMWWPTGAPASADLDGDGVQDLVFWANPRHLVAVNGASGQVMWDREVTDGPNTQNRWNRYIFSWDTERLDLPVPAVLDLDGKGSYGVAFVHRPKDRDRVVVLNGKDGKERWAWEGPPARTPTDYLPADILTEPRVVRLREGTFLLAVACGTAPPSMPGFSPGLSRHLVLLDMAGKEYQRRELRGPAHIYATLNTLPLWVADLDGDGFDEIAFAADDSERLVVTKNGVKSEFWSIAYQLGEHTLSVQPSKNGRAGLVLLRTDNTMRGVDGKTGNPLWACFGPSTGPCLIPADPATPPLVVFIPPDQGIIVRRAMPVGLDGRFVVPGTK